MRIISQESAIRLGRGRTRVCVKISNVSDSARPQFDDVEAARARRKIRAVHEEAGSVRSVRAAADRAHVDIERPPHDSRLLIRRGGLFDNSAIDEEGSIGAQTAVSLEVRGAARVHELDEIPGKAVRPIVLDSNGECTLLAAIFHEPIERRVRRRWREMKERR